jgi:hypothetical protein
VTLCPLWNVCQASGQLEEALQAAESQGRGLESAVGPAQQQPRRQRRERRQQQHSQLAADGRGRSRVDASGRELLGSMSDDESSDMLTAR